MTTAYITVDEAQDFFDERLNTGAWDDASATDKAKALKQATKSMNRLNFAGDPTEDDQENSFPRGEDEDVPQDIKDACCLEALALLDGVDISLEKANLAASSQGIGDARATYDRGFVVTHIVHGIASAEAWDLMRPFLRDASDVKISRES